MPLAQSMTLTRRFAVLLILVSPLAVADQAAEQSLKQLIAGLDTYSARFQQSVTEEDGYLLDENSGVMSFEQPSKLYWQVFDPFPSTLVSDGAQLYFYDPDLNQVTIRDWSSDPSQNPLAVFMGESDLSDYYSVAYGDQQYILTPKSADSSAIELALRFEADRLVEMSFLDSLGQRTRIELSGNEELVIPENPYQFDIPIDAEIIRDQ